MDLVDDQHLEQCRGFLQLQAKLLGQGAEQRAEAERLDSCAEQRMAGADGGDRKESEPQPEVVPVGEACPIDQRKLGRQRRIGPRLFDGWP
jgi:hypothetical protein